MAQPDTYKPLPTQQPIQPTAKKSGCGCGCFAAGCLTVIVLIILALVGLFFVFRSYLYKLTSDTPIALPQVEVQESDLPVVQSKLAAFEAAMTGTGQVAPLALSGREINSLIALHPESKPLAEFFGVKSLGEVVRIQINGDQMQFDASLPLPAVFAGRYVNVSGAFTAHYLKKKLTVNVQNFSYNGQLLSEAEMKALRGQDFGAEIAKNPDTSRLLEKLESLEIRDGNLVVTPKEEK